MRTYEYRVLKTNFPDRLEADLNRLDEDGFSLQYIMFNNNSTIVAVLMRYVRQVEEGVSNEPISKGN